MQRVFILLLSIFCSFWGFSQVLKGRITNAKGDPVSYATVYIREIMMGMVADDEGNFQTKLKQGTYSCEIRSLGFAPQTKIISITENETDLKVVLIEKPHELKEVTVSSTKEDPAYTIMGRTIAKAPFHLYQVSGFSSENYLKGSAKIEKIPGLMKMMIKDKQLKAMIGKLFVLESKNEISFRSPAKYIQRVIAYKSSIPKEMEPKGGIRVPTSNIYDPDFMSMISPLSPEAFRYYKFHLEDSFRNGNYLIYKIQLRPKLKNEKLFSGFIYIVDDNWSVFSLDLSSTDTGTSTHSKINYQEVEPSVFMPITYDTYTDIGTMGVKGYARFYSSVKYTKINLNKSVIAVQQQNKTAKVTDPLSKKQKKLQDKIEELSTKDKLSTKDAVKLYLLTKQTAEPKELKEQREALKIIDVEKVSLEIDSMALQHDSIYWEDIRNVPLRADEAKSFNEKDSLPVSKSISTGNNSISFSVKDSTKSWNWLMGGMIPIGKSVQFSYQGLLGGVLREYNFVDGFWLGQKLKLNINTSKKTDLNVATSAYYTTARKAIVWNVNSEYQYAPMALGQLKVLFGNTTTDIQQNQGTSRFFNSLSSLFFGDNVIRFYQKQYFSFENQIDISNGLRLTAGSTYEHRQLLENKTNYHFFGIIPQPNSPDQAYSEAFTIHSATVVQLKLEYTPFYKYRVKDGKKEYAGSAYPTFVVDYKKAIPVFKEAEQSSYDKIEVSAKQNLTLSEFDKLNYKVSLGGFLTKQKLYAPDLKYFATSPLFITNRPFESGFNLLENYTSSNNRWLETQINWTSDYLLLKRIGFLQTYSFNEMLLVHSLWNLQYEKLFAEIGYSIGFNNFGRIGVFSAFDGFYYKNGGIKISIPLFSGSNKD